MLGISGIGGGVTVPDGGVTIGVVGVDFGVCGSVGLELGLGDVVLWVGEGDCVGFCVGGGVG